MEWFVFICKIGIGGKGFEIFIFWEFDDDVVDFFFKGFINFWYFDVRIWVYVVGVVVKY